MYAYTFTREALERNLAAICPPGVHGAIGEVTTFHEVVIDLRASPLKRLRMWLYSNAEQVRLQIEDELYEQTSLPMGTSLDVVWSHDMER